MTTDKYNAVRHKIQELVPQLETKEIHDGYSNWKVGGEPRLADVLRAINEQNWMEHQEIVSTQIDSLRIEVGDRYCFYKLTDDRLNQQSEETIDSLYQILIGE